MRVRNPNYSYDPPAGAGGRAAAVTKIIDYLTANAGKESVTFDELRALFTTAQRKKLTDGVLHQLAIDAGLEVDAG